jgi:hypothetical protein
VYFDTYLCWQEEGNCIIQNSFRKTLCSAYIKYIHKRKKAV